MLNPMVYRIGNEGAEIGWATKASESDSLDKIQTLLKEMVEDFHKMKLDKEKRVTVVDYKTLNQVIADLMHVIPESYFPPTELIKKKKGFYELVGIIINKVVKYDFLKYKNDTLSLEDIKRDSVVLKNSRWDKPEDLYENLVDRLKFRDAMVKDLKELSASLKEKSFDDKEAPLTITKVGTLCKSINQVTNDITILFAGSLQDVIFNARELDENEEVEERNYLKELQKLLDDYSVTFPKF